MRIGSLRHYISIQSESRTPDGMGGSTVIPVTVYTAWASIEPLSGKELFQAQQLQSQVTHKITIRYRPGITSDLQVLFGSRKFEITSVINPEERNVTLIMMCRERFNNG